MSKRRNQLIEALNAELELNCALVKMRIASVKSFDRTTDDDEDYLGDFNTVIDLVEQAVNKLDNMQTCLMVDVKAEDVIEDDYNWAKEHNDIDYSKQDELKERQERESY